MTPDGYTIRAARDDEHDEIVRVAKLSPYTSDFSNRIMFSAKSSYDRGWVRVALAGDGVTTAGFACTRDKIRQPECTLYFVGVHPQHQRRGLAWALCRSVMDHSSHKIMVLKCAKSNSQAKALYDKQGFLTTGETPDYWLMRRVFL